MTVGVPQAMASMVRTPKPSPMVALTRRSARLSSSAISAGESGRKERGFSVVGFRLSGSEEEERVGALGIGPRQLTAENR